MILFIGFYYRTSVGSYSTSTPMRSGTSTNPIRARRDLFNMSAIGARDISDSSPPDDTEIYRLEVTRKILLTNVRFLNLFLFLGRN